MDGLFLDRSGPATTRCSKRWRDGPSRSARTAADALHYFLINKGPWSRLDHNKPFVPGVPAKPEGANFYPAGAIERGNPEMDRLVDRRRQSGGDRLLHDDSPRA